MFTAILVTDIGRWYWCYLQDPRVQWAAQRSTHICLVHWTGNYCFQLSILLLKHHSS